MTNFKPGGGFGNRKSGGFKDRNSGGFNDRQGSGGFERRGPGGRDFKRGGGSGFNPLPKFKAICAECGQPCEVPFKPTGERPVYCSNCFKEKQEGNNRSGGRDFSKPNFREVARPSFDRPSDRPRNDRGDSRMTTGGPTKEQFEALNAKLDKVLRALEHLSSLTRAPQMATNVAAGKNVTKAIAPQTGVAKTASPVMALKAVNKKAVKKSAKK